MSVARAFASGKLILVGEHAVVHGQPALAFAVDRGSDVTLERIDGPLELVSPVRDPLLDEAVTALLGHRGFRVTLTSSLPLGRGMGSSASLAVALVRAARALGVPAAQGDEVTAALLLERVFHANPSGVDVAVIRHGGVLRFQRTDPPTMQPLSCPDWAGVVVDTGRAGSTKALVAGVTARRPGIDPLLRAIGTLVDQAQGVLHDPTALGPLLLENHRLLGAIGVSTPELDAIVALATKAGAHGAKLSGAGGGGVVLALHDEPQRLVHMARERGYDAWPVRPLPAPRPLVP